MKAGRVTLTWAPAGVALLLVMAGTPARSADAPEAPRYNPFHRPVAATAAAVAADGQPAPEAAAPRLLLKSMLLAGPDTVVSINGQLLRIGESVDGWRLLSARPGRATLAKGRERIELNMDDEDGKP
jgi:hypothetical protein